MSNLSPAYYDKFTCLGSECPDTCCQGWRITLDKKTHEKYINSKDKRISEISKRYIKKITPPDDNLFSYIAMNNKGHCPFLDKSKLCGLQVKYGEKILSGTCDAFPKIQVQYPDHTKLNILDISCPEAARICLTDPSSMKILENKKQIKNNYLKFFEESFTYSKIGEKVLNFCFSLITNKKFKLSETSLIINLIIQERENLCKNKNLVDSFFIDVKKRFVGLKIINFDTSYIKIEFLDDFVSYFKKHAENTEVNAHSFLNLLNNAHYELIGRFKNLDEAVTNFKNSEKKYFKQYNNNKNYIFRNFYANELLQSCIIFTNPKRFKENTLLLSYLTDVVIRYLCLSDLSKKKELNDANLVDYFYKFKRVYPLYSSFTPFMQKKISNNILILLKKIDPNSAFNSLYFLNN